MFIAETTQGNREVSFQPGERLTTNQLILALVDKGNHTKTQATTEINYLFDAMEEQWHLSSVAALIKAGEL